MSRISVLSRSRAYIGEQILGPYSNSSHFFHRVRKDDIYIVSFPRSGNTWVRYFLTSLISDREPCPELVQSVIPDVYQVRPRLRPRTLRRLIAKSHGPVTGIPCNVVYLVRDGRAALHSYFHYLTAAGVEWVPPSVSDMLTWDELWPCTWAEHVEGWTSEITRTGKGIIIRYEDLISRPEQEFSRIADYCSLPTEKRAVKRAVQLSSRDRMADVESRSNGGALNYVNQTRDIWKGAFEPMRLATFEATYGHLLRRFGYP